MAERSVSESGEGADQVGPRDAQPGPTLEFSDWSPAGHLAPRGSTPHSFLCLTLSSPKLLGEDVTAKG